jgi:Protein of unknown function (DUF3501)
MPRDTRTITAADMLDLQDYAKIRKEKREENVLRKRFRRISVGPHVTVFFENYDTMWMQVQEMLFVEKGGDAQLVDELAAYNPMVPNGAELTTTLMFEIDDERVRRRVLGAIGGIEKHIYITIGTDKIYAVPEQDVDRTNDAGKASSVHFLHFPFSEEQIAAFTNSDHQAAFNIDHPNYGHIAILPADVRIELARDFG